MPRNTKAERLLAAPEFTASELSKYEKRKELERAEKARIKAGKRKTLPSVEDLLADLVRVASDEVYNPWHAFRSLSRRRYELFGEFPVEFIDRKFGEFQHALEVAGLRDQPGTRLWRRNTASTSRREHAKRYVERYVEPYTVQARERRELHEPYLLLSISDTHATFLDPFTWHCFLSAIRDLRPSGVLLNGDILEGSEIAKWPKVPGWGIPLQLELDFAREMVRQIRQVGHDGDLFLCGGNHGVDRLAMYLTQVSSALANLRSLRIDQLLGLDEFGVQLFQGGTIASPKHEEDAKPGFLLFGYYRVHHGVRCGNDPARHELRDAGRSGQSGHVHRAQVAYGTSERDEGLSWMSTPCACSDLAARSYIKATSTGWQRGFGVAWLFPDGTVHQYPVVTSRSWCIVEGYAYLRPGNIAQPEPDRLWLTDQPIPGAECNTRPLRTSSTPQRKSCATSGRPRSASTGKGSAGRTSARTRSTRSKANSRKRRKASG